MVLRYFRRTVWIFSFTIASLIFDQNDKDYEKLREAMVKMQIESRGVKNEEVLSAIRGVPRHLFIDESLWPTAYSDGPLPIG